MSEPKIHRRRFLKAGAMGFIGWGAAAGSAGALDTSDPEPEIESENSEDQAPKIRRYNLLGKTGLKVSDISMGLGGEDSVYHYAVDRGINLFDTAESYYNGRHEKDVGRALKKVRDKVVITTKHKFNNPKKIKTKKVVKRFEDSLKRLGSDHVDLALWHEVADPKLFECEELLRAYEDLKKAGKFRFLGFSTHQAETICPIAFETKLFSAMMVIYNSVQYPDRSKHITQAAKLGLGVITMKSMMGQEQDKLVELADERTSYPQAAIKWALTDQSVSSVMITIRTFEHVDEYLGISGQKLTDKDQGVLKKYVRAVDNRYCRVGCTACLASCPNRVAIQDVMRFGMYYENYGEEKRAMQEYARLKKHHRAAPCSSCSGMCESACPHKLSIRERLSRYDGLLRV